MQCPMLGGAVQQRRSQALDCAYGWWPLAASPIETGPGRPEARPRGKGRFSAGRATEDGTHDSEVQKDTNLGFNLSQLIYNHIILPTPFGHPARYLTPPLTASPLRITLRASCQPDVPEPSLLLPFQRSRAAICTLRHSRCGW